MSKNRRVENSPEHHEVVLLLPWYVNASLEDNERQRVDAHLGICAECRDSVAAEQRIFAALNRESAIEYMPAASLKRLQARLDVVQGHNEARALVPSAPLRAGMPWRVLAAASIGLLAVGLSLLIGDRWMQSRANSAAANYRTVTSSTPRPRDEVIRAVFSPTITLIELQAILDESQLRIISGPSEAGVYSLAANSTRPVHASLTLLRQHSTVRFAEETLSEPLAGSSP
jgi:anti-sigma factor RsiW